MSRRACSSANEECPQYNLPLGCHVDTHHAFFPRKNYTTSTERRFRELPENKTEVCRNLHNEIHATGVIPEKPEPLEMKRAINLSRAEAKNLGSIAVERAI